MYEPLGPGPSWQPSPQSSYNHGTLGLYPCLLDILKINPIVDLAKPPVTAGDCVTSDTNPGATLPSFPRVLEGLPLASHLELELRGSCDRLTP